MSVTPTIESAALGRSVTHPSGNTDSTTAQATPKQGDRSAAGSSTLPRGALPFGLSDSGLRRRVPNEPYCSHGGSDASQRWPQSHGGI